MHLRRALPLLSVAAAVHATSGIPGLGHVDNLFVFGDSYTDQGRLAWFTAHGGEAPPAGTFIPAASPTASGGYSWPYFVSGSLNATTFNYAGKGRGEPVLLALLCCGLGRGLRLHQDYILEHLS